MTHLATRRLSIFAHRASECLTDHESHGDGLICFSLLNGLAERGHQIYAYTSYATIRTCSPRLQVRVEHHRSPANSLAPWEHARRADRWLKQLVRDREIDLVWRMHPYGAGCPCPPSTLGKPLVVGPMFYPWPRHGAMPPKTGLPRFGISLYGLIRPAAERGWRHTLRNARLLICPTANHTMAMKDQFPKADVLHLPVIVDPPHLKQPLAREWLGNSRGIRLLFIANLVPNKNPRIFCEAVRCLRDAGTPTEAIVLGDGPERPALEAYCCSLGLQHSIYFKGKVPNTEIWSYLRQTDFLISTSLGEPYGRSIVEAMSVGTPVVCHASGGPADIIEHKVDGLLIKDLDAKMYANAISYLYTDPVLWRSLSKNALRKAHNWTSEVVLSRLEEALCCISRAEAR